MPNLDIAGAHGIDPAFQFRSLFSARLGQLQAGSAASPPALPREDGNRNGRMSPDLETLWLFMPRNPFSNGALADSPCPRRGSPLTGMMVYTFRYNGALLALGRARSVQKACHVSRPACRAKKGACLPHRSPQKRLEILWSPLGLLPVLGMSHHGRREAADARLACPSVPRVRRPCSKSNAIELRSALRSRFPEHRPRDL